MDRARRNRLLVLAVGLVAVVVVAVALRFLLRPDPRLLLPEARGLVDEAAGLDAGSGRTDRASKAERLLRRYLDRSQEEVSQATLLLACALILKQSDLASPPWKTEMEIRGLLGRIDVRRCDTEDLIRGASILFEGGHLREAAAFAEAALRRGDHREEALRVASEICLEQGAGMAALELCREWAKLVPDDPRPLEIMGAIHEARSETDQLIKIDRRLLDLKPDNATEIRHRLVDNLVATGEAAEAREQYDLLRAEGTLGVRLEVTEAGLLYLEGDFEGASQRVRQVLEADAENHRALKLRGKIQLGQLRTSEAIETFRRLVEFDPTDYESHYLLGQAYSQNGDIEQAQRHLQIHRKILGL
ncbi:MAG: tetratricopeptide repeat protein [Planctomycetes bacterium]|nr:tetratricopeptide repeat protein [Planctomycetota bacterium]MBL7039412.1 tetratricopeptide repeat protein [Pirellulaceae bacterium]